MSKVVNKIEIEDLFVFAGLGCLGSGISMISLPLALATVGALMFLLGILIVVGGARK